MSLLHEGVLDAVAHAQVAVLDVPVLHGKVVLRPDLVAHSALLVLQADK